MRGPKWQFFLTSHHNRSKVTGVIYCHDINETRLTRVSNQAIELFEELCGPEAMHNIVLCTTKWDKLQDETEGDRKQSELETEYWKSIIAGGAQVARHNRGRQESAKEIVACVLNGKPVELKLTKELRRPGMTLGKTSAGRLSGSYNERKAKEIQKSLDKLENPVAAARAKAEAKREEKEAEWNAREEKMVRELGEAGAAADKAGRLTRAFRDHKVKHAEQELKKVMDAKKKSEEKENETGFGLMAKERRMIEEYERLQGELEKTRTERANLAKPLNAVEYSKQTGARILGKHLGRLVGGVFGHVGKAALDIGDFAAAAVGGTRPSERA